MNRVEVILLLGIGMFFGFLVTVAAGPDPQGHHLFFDAQALWGGAFAFAGASLTAWRLYLKQVSDEENAEKNREAEDRRIQERAIKQRTGAAANLAGEFLFNTRTIVNLLDTPELEHWRAIFAVTQVEKLFGFKMFDRIMSENPDFSVAVIANAHKSHQETMSFYQLVQVVIESPKDSVGVRSLVEVAESAAYANVRFLTDLAHIHRSAGQNNQAQWIASYCSDVTTRFTDQERTATVIRGLQVFHDEAAGN